MGHRGGDTPERSAAPAHGGQGLPRLGQNFRCRIGRVVVVGAVDGGDSRNDGADVDPSREVALGRDSQGARQEPVSVSEGHND